MGRIRGVPRWGGKPLYEGNNGFFYFPALPAIRRPLHFPGHGPP